MYDLSRVGNTEMAEERFPILIPGNTTMIDLPFQRISFGMGNFPVCDTQTFQKTPQMAAAIGPVIEDIPGIEQDGADSSRFALQRSWNGTLFKFQQRQKLLQIADDGIGSWTFVFFAMIEIVEDLNGEPKTSLAGAQDIPGDAVTDIERRLPVGTLARRAA